MTTSNGINHHDECSITLNKTLRAPTPSSHFLSSTFSNSCDIVTFFKFSMHNR